MFSENDIPRLRADLEIIPTSSGGKTALVIRDHLGLVRDPVLIQSDGLVLLGLIDGKRSLRDIQVALIRQRGGMMVTLESVGRLMEELDDAFLLQSERYLRERERVFDEYRRLEIRAASLAGRSYPGRAGDLGLYLDSILRPDKFPAEAVDSRPIRGLIAPHIDLEVGARVYATAYNAIRALAPRTIILLGTGHGMGEAYYSLTEKDFETPLGLVKTEKALVRKLRKAGGPAVEDSDLSHRREHSLEFQLIFLQHLFGSGFTLVPILCGSFVGALDRASRPSGIAGAGELLTLLKFVRDEKGPDCLVVAGVDFSHIGPKFGHDRNASLLIPEARDHDQKLIEALSRGDVEGFWAESRRVEDRFNVCGFSAMASLLEILPAVKGRLLNYEFWKEEPTRSAVSFAAIVFREFHNI